MNVRIAKGGFTAPLTMVACDDEVLAWIKQQQDKQPHHRGDLVGPRRSNQKAGPMKDRVDRLAQGTKSRAQPVRLGRRRCDSEVSAAPAQAASEAAE